MSNNYAFDQQDIDTGLYNFLSGAGEMADLIRSYNWAQTSLGDIATWPQSLKTAVNIVLQSPVPLVMLWGIDGVMIYNDAYSVFAGARHPFLLGSKVLEGWPEVADFNRNVMDKGLQGKTLSYTNQPLTLYRNNVPETVWMDLNYSPIMDERGIPAGVLAIVVETTQRVLAEQKQRQAEEALVAANAAVVRERERLLSNFMQAPNLVIIFNGPEHVIELANPLALRVWGKKRQQEVINKPLLEAVPELAGQGIKELLDEVYQSGKAHYGNELKVRLFGEEDSGKLEDMYFTFVYEPMRNREGVVEGIMAIAYIVTDQVLSRKRVEESEEKYRSLFTSMDQGFCIIEMIFDERLTPIDYRFLEVNPMFQKQTGLTNATGKTARELVANLEDSWFQIYGNVALTGEASRFIEGSETMGRWFEVYAFRTGGDQSRKVAILFNDITVRKLGEEALRQSEERFKKLAEQLEKLVDERTEELHRANTDLLKSNEDLQQFAHVASHDLKEPLRKIKTFIHRLSDESLDDPHNKARVYIEKILASAERMSTMIEGVLTYSTLSNAEWKLEKLELNHVIEEISDDLEVVIQQKGAVIKSANLPIVDGVKVLIHQLFYNLINNSLKFAKPDQPPVVNISGKRITIDAVEYVEILITDNGIGFDPSYSKKIFETFTRLNRKDLYDGTGLGLSLCRKIVERHQGTIEAESTIDKGATFTVRLPIRHE